MPGEVTAWVFRAGERGTDSQKSGHDSSDKCHLSKMTDSEQKENSYPSLRQITDLNCSSCLLLRANLSHIFKQASAHFVYK